MNDNYDHSESDAIKYILESELQEDDGTEDFKMLRHEYDAQIMKCCSCEENCTELSCSHGGNYIYDKDSQELVLNENRKSKDVIYECNSLCDCSFDCNNRLAVFGPRKSLEIITNDKGYGLITKSKISKGAFICEYAGEILTKAEAIKRSRIIDENNLMNYIILLNESSSNGCDTSQIQTFIDPSKKGNIGRYLNHSCDNNCEIISVRIDSPVPKLCIFACRGIDEGEELCFHYGGGKSSNQSSQQVKECLCKSKKCMKILPNWSFEDQS